MGDSKKTDENSNEKVNTTVDEKTNEKVNKEEIKVEKATAKEENSSKKSKKTRRLLVILAILIFAVYTFITYKADYIHYRQIGEQYESVFMTKVKNKYSIMGFSFVVLYIYLFINNKFISRGLKKFFEEEKKEFPKLPNKSICFIAALFGSIVATNMLADKFLIITNAALFGKSDPIFGTDIGFYMFSLPFFQTLILFIGEVLLFTIAYTGLYYVISLNVYFDGVNGETLKKNTFVKHEITIAVLAIIVVCAYILINTQNIMTGEMLTLGDENSTVIIGASKSDVTIKLWGYRILCVVILAATIRLVRFIRLRNFKQGIISALIVPAYLLCLFAALIYYQEIHIGSNEFDNEREFIAHNINYTKEAYNINIDQKNIDKYTEVSANEIETNKAVIDNIPVITEDVVKTTILEHQENSVYYAYDNTFLASYNYKNQDTLAYLTPREILPESAKSYRNRTYKYTHGYSMIINKANDADSDGYMDYILSDFQGEKQLGIEQPRIYYGLETNSTIVVNSPEGKEYDYPQSETEFAENVYDGEGGINLGFFDRLILGLSEHNIKLATSKRSDDTKILSDRNILKRVQKIFPDVIYDEEPYLVITNEGKLVWVLDGYTRSSAYPYSQNTIINIKGYREKLNYIRNSVKVLIDAYDGTTKFYIVDESDPIILTYRNIYPDLFTDEAIPQDIASHMIYPEFLYNIQSNMLNIYHNVSEDTLYRTDDIWQITTKASSTKSTVAGVQMTPYYTVLKTADKNNPDVGLVLTYNKYGKQNITAYLVGRVDSTGKQYLSLYKFNSASNVVGIMQLNNQIEQDSTISAELESINTTGTRLKREMIIVPINNSLLYVEPVYQEMLNGKSEVPILKKVIVASGNTVAIGDNLESAINNLFSETKSVDLDIVNTDDINQIIDSLIKANQNLNESLNSNNFEMIGKDITKIQSIINQLEQARKLEIEKENQEKGLLGTDVVNNEVTNETEDSNFLSSLLNTLNKSDNAVDNNTTVNQNLVNVNR